MVDSAGNLHGGRRRRSRWYLIYFILALFDILTITGSLYISRQIIDIYASSVNDNQKWTERLAQFLKLEQLAALANAPGNDLFNSLNVAAEEARRDAAFAGFTAHLETVRADVSAGLTVGQAGVLVTGLDNLARTMNGMAAASDDIFEHFRLGEFEMAAQCMADMDRHYAEATTAMVGLFGQLAEIQKRQLRQQLTAAEHLGEFKYLIGCLVVVMVVGLSTYGYALVRRARADEEERERYAVSLAKARDAANAASRAKSDFLATMSHEIRTPMTAMLGMADLLAASNLPPPLRGYVDAIGSAGRHLLAIVNNLLDLSRLEAVGLELQQVTFSVSDLVEQVRVLMAPQASEQGIMLRVDTAGLELMPVLGDPTRLRQVLLNLIGNALKFTRRGSVVVRVEQRPADAGGSLFRFEVQDTGIGIPLERQAQLFVAFGQVSEPKGSAPSGSGLGLAISKRLVEAMGGTIGADSTPGEGSLFWFEVRLQHGHSMLAAPWRSEHPYPTAPLRLLVVEDIAVNRQLLGEMLRRRGHEVAFAEHGAEAVDLVRQQRFDLIVMDVRLPVMDGLEATRCIRGLPEPVCDVPIVGLTANALDQERRACIRAGMDRCLAKPIAWPELFAVIDELGAVSASTPMGSGREVLRDVSSACDRPAGSLAGGDLAGLLRQVIEDAERIHARLRLLPSGSAELEDEAHKLKGMAGLFGLGHIRAAASELQAALRNHGDVARALGQLAAALAASRRKIDGVRPAGPDATGPDEIRAQQEA